MNANLLRNSLSVTFQGKDIFVHLEDKGRSVEVYRVPLKDILQGTGNREMLDDSFETCRDLCIRIRDAIDAYEREAAQ